MQIVIRQAGPCESSRHRAFRRFMGKCDSFQIGELCDRSSVLSCSQNQPDVWPENPRISWSLMRVFWISVAAFISKSYVIVSVMNSYTGSELLFRKFLPNRTVRASFPSPMCFSHSSTGLRACESEANSTSKTLFSQDRSQLADEPNSQTSNVLSIS